MPIGNRPAGGADADELSMCRPIAMKTVAFIDNRRKRVGSKTAK